MCVYSQRWVCESVVGTVCDAVRAVTGGPEQRGGRKTTSAAGWQWPAWSSAGPATHTHTRTYIYQYAFMLMYILPYISQITPSYDGYIVLLYDDGPIFIVN